MKREDVLKEIGNIKDQLVEKYRPERIILFGFSVTDENDECEFLLAKEKQ